jgi:transposase-like protein
MMFRHSTCAVCGKVPPSLGFAELPAEQQGPPAPPSRQELGRLWAMRTQPNPYCPRCRHAVGLHIARLAEGLGELGRDTDTTVARALKVPVVMLRNLRILLEIPAAPPRIPGYAVRLTAEQLAAYRDGQMSVTEAASRAGTSVSAVRGWRQRHIDQVDCPPPPEPIPPPFYDLSVPEETVARVCGCVAGTVWKWRRQHADELRPQRALVRHRLVAGGEPAPPPHPVISALAARSPARDR